jgi:DNA-binding NarL/FixJ family response regulator
MVTILLADDHPLVRRGLRNLLEAQPDFSVCGEAADGQEAVRLAGEARPDVAILDMAMPGMNGLEATRRIRAASPRTQVLIVSMMDSDEAVRRAAEAGARGYVLKSDCERALLDAVSALAMRRPWFNGAAGSAILGAFLGGTGARDGGEHEPLTPREREVAQLVAEGLSNKHISRRLEISVKTVETHRSSLMRKIGARSAVEVARYATRNGIAFP